LSLFNELKRRNVFRVALAYAVVAWLLLQVGDTLAPALHLPEWATSLLAFFLIIGFPLAIFFAWAFELTPEGIRPEKSVSREQSVTRSTGRKLDFIVIGLLAITIAYFSYDKFDGSDELVATTDSDPSRRSIAVLPFVNMSSDPEQEYFSDGLSEELLNLLAKIPQLRVTSRSSAFYYKGKDIKISEIGRELGVDHILEGSVRKSGDDIRITAQLINVKDDAHIWSETWDRDLKNIFDVQDEIAEAISVALEIQLVHELPQAYVTDPQTYNMYLQAIESAKDFTQPGFEKTEKLLLQALAIDPNYAPAIALLGKTIINIGNWDDRPENESFELGREYAQRAIDADPGFAGGYALLGRIATMYDADIESAREWFNKAIALEETNVRIRMQLAFTYLMEGDASSYLLAARERAKLDPLNATTWRVVGWAAMWNRESVEALRAFRRMQTLNPDGIATRTMIAEAHFAAGNYEQALINFEAEPIEGFKYYGRTMVHHMLGNHAESDEALAKLIEIDNNEWAAQIAMAHAVRGETDDALEWLNVGFERHDQGLQASAVNPFLDNLRGEPRFEAFLKRLQYPPGSTD
jgi:adenylate cyclase